MIELAVFWGIPLIFMLTAMQSPFFQNWRFLLVLALSGYLALWCFPLSQNLMVLLLPKEFREYSNGAALAASLIVFALILFQLACHFSGHGGNGYHLPSGKNILCPILGLISGFIFSGLAGYVLCLTPFHARITSDTSFGDQAVTRVCVLTAVIDRLSLQSYPVSVRRKKLQSRLSPLKKPAKPAEIKKADPNPAQPAPPSKSAPSSAPENNAAEEQQRSRYSIFLLSSPGGTGEFQCYIKHEDHLSASDLANDPNRKES